MSTTTTKLGLIKPELSDTADITAMNHNWDRLDNLTPSDVGAAPAGYGLGTVATKYHPNTEAEMNTMLTECVGKLQDNSFGCFVFFDNTGDIWGGSAVHATVFKTNSSYAFVTFDGYYHSNCNRFTKTLYNGNWQPMAWENPHMQSGVEYRTTERWNGKPVYAALVSLGNLPNATSKTVSVPGDKVATNIVRFNAIATVSGKFAYDMRRLSGLTKFEVRYGTDSNLYMTMYTSEDMSAYTGTCQIWYTKD